MQAQEDVLRLQAALAEAHRRTDLVATQAQLESTEGAARLQGENEGLRGELYAMQVQLTPTALLMFRTDRVEAKGWTSSRCSCCRAHCSVSFGCEGGHEGCCPRLRATQVMI